MEPLFIGLDLGTQSLKGALVNLRGEVLAWSHVNRPPRYPRPGWVEMDAEGDWWQPALAVLRGLLAGDSTRARAVLGVGICGMVPCLCLLDARGHPLRPAILYSDNRALAELEEVRALGGLELTAEAVLPKLLWLQHHESAAFRSASSVLSAHNYLVYRLTGRLCVDYDTASIYGGIFNARARTWNRDLIARLGLPPEIFPETLPAPMPAGEIGQEAAEASGLLAGTPVLVGTGDTFANLVGCGAVEAGDAMIAIGTSGLLTLTQAPLLDSVMGPHFDDGSGLAAVRWAANVLSAGQLVSWYAGQLGLPGTDCALEDSELLHRLDQSARLAPAGADGLLALPHWLGRRAPQPDPLVRGAFIGLTPSHTSAHLYRALLEAFGYNLRQGFEGIRPLARRIILTGGGARSSLWREILAGILERELVYTPRASGALGMAFLAAWGSGAVHEFDAVRSTWLGQMETTTPNPADRDLYRAAYHRYAIFDQAISLAYQKIDS